MTDNKTLYLEAFYNKNLKCKMKYKTFKWYTFGKYYLLIDESIIDTFNIQVIEFCIIFCIFYTFLL